LATLAGHTDDVFGAQFSPDGSLIATHSSDSTVRLWSASGELLIALTGRSSGTAAEFLADGTRILTTTSGLPRLWEVFDVVDLDTETVRRLDGRELTDSECLRFGIEPCM
jgi:WD40 repeat protein